MRRREAERQTVPHTERSGRKISWINTTASLVQVVDSQRTVSRTGWRMRVRHFHYNHYPLPLLVVALCIQPASLIQ